MGYRGKVIPGFPLKLEIWAKAQKTKIEADWVIFHQLCNKCTSLNKKAKSEVYLSATSKNCNDPKTFLERQDASWFGIWQVGHDGWRLELIPPFLRSQKVSRKAQSHFVDDLL